MLRIPIKIIAFVIVNKHQFNLFQVADSFDDRSIEARFAKVVQSASEASNGGVPGGHHGRTSRPRPQLSTTSAEAGIWVSQGPRTQESLGHPDTGWVLPWTLIMTVRRASRPLIAVGL